MNLSATRYVAPVLVSASLFLAECGALSGDGAEVNQTRITTAFSPLESAAERVAGDQFDVVNLTGPGTEPHDLELSVKQTGQVSDARLVSFQKGFQPAVDKAVEQNASGDTLDASEVVELRGYSEDEEPAHADESHDDEGHDDEGAAHADERSEEHTSELQSLMRTSYAVICLKKTTSKETRDTTRNKD